VSKRLILLSVLLPLVARADLQWVSPKAFIAADPSEPHAFTKFLFTNTGSYPIRIMGTHTSCGCTAAVADARPVAPGGTGTINISFRTLNRHGLYEEPILIDTDDPKNKQCTVTLRILVQDAVEVLPTLLFWQPDEPLTPKIVLITVTDGFDVKSVAAQCPDPNVQTRLDIIKPGATYKLTVTPTAPHVKAKIAVTAGVEGKSARSVTVLVRVS
jgi:hypothetical protein